MSPLADSTEKGEPRGLRRRTTSAGKLTRASDDTGDIQHVLVVHLHPDALRRVLVEFTQFAHDATHDGWWYRLRERFSGLLARK